MIRMRSGGHVCIVNSTKNEKEKRERGERVRERDRERERGTKGGRERCVDYTNKQRGRNKGAKCVKFVYVLCSCMMYAVKLRWSMRWPVLM